MGQGPVFKGIINALSKSEGLLEKFWLQDIVPNVTKTSKFSTTLAFGLLKLIVTFWPNQETLAILLPKSLAAISLQLLSKIESSTEEDLMISSALESLVLKSKGCAQAEKDLLSTFLSVNVSFDKVAGTNLIQKILNNSTPETVKLAADFYKEALASEGACFSTQQRVFAGQQLAKIVGHPAMQNEHAWKTEVICFLLTLTQFDVRKVQWPLKAMPQPLQREAKFDLKEVFFKALDLKMKNLESACGILTKIVLHAETLLKTDSPFQPMNKEAKKAWNEMMTTVKKINDNTKQNSALKKAENVFLMLLIHIGLQLFSMESKTAIDLLQDLHVCYEKAKNSGNNKKSGKKSKKSEQAEDEPEWVEVVTDLMLSLLSQNRNVLRQVVNSVTAMLCPYMTPKALLTILDVINPPKDESEGMEEDSEEEDDEFEPITEEDLAKLKVINYV